MARIRDTFGIVTIIRYTLSTSGKLIVPPASEMLVYPSTESACKSTMYAAGQMSAQEGAEIDIDNLENVVTATKTTDSGCTEVTVWKISECEYVTTKKEFQPVTSPDTSAVIFMNEQMDAYHAERDERIRSEIKAGRSPYDIWVNGNYTYKEVDGVVRKLEKSAGKSGSGNTHVRDTKIQDKEA